MFVTTITHDFHLYAGTLTEIVDKINAALKEAKNSIEDKVRKKVAKIVDEQQRTEFINDQAGEDILHSDLIPQFAYRSMFITAYAAFEHSLKGTCRDAHSANLSTQPVPTKNFYIDDMKKYLTAINGFATSAFDSHWNEIADGWRYIRNAFVHDNGIVEVDGPDGIKIPTKYAINIKAFASKQPHIKVNGDTTVLDQESTNAFLKCAVNALDSITSELTRLAPPPTERIR